MSGGWGAVVGRDREQRLLRRALEAAATGRGGLVLVTGDAGIGKTALCADFAGHAASTADVAWTTCWEAEEVPAFWPWSHLLTTLGAPPDPPERDGIASGDPWATRIAWFEHLTSRLEQRASKRPLLLVIDDLHWADEPSRELLRFLAPRLRTIPVLVVGTVRTGDGFDGADDLGRYGGHVRLLGLDRTALEQVVAAATGSPPTGAELDVLVARSGGNPLFALELATAGEPADLPVGVQSVLARRFDRLDDTTVEVLEAAAVLAEEATLDAVAALVDRPATDVLLLLDPADRAHLVRVAEPAVVRFTHPLMRATLLERMGLARRIRWHQRAGVVLEELRARGRPVELATLAGHFAAAAGAGSAPAAVGYAQAAGDEAMAMLAYEQAARQYTRALTALDLAPDAADRTALLLRRGDALLAAGRPSEARSSYRDAVNCARQDGDSSAFATAALAVGSGGGFEVALFDAEQLALLDEAVTRVGDSEPVTLARLLARRSVAQSLLEPVERRRPLAEEALLLARQVGDAAATCDALAALCDAIAGPADVERRLALAGELVELASTTHDVRRELLGRRLLVVSHWERGAIAEVDAQIERYAAAAVRLRLPLYDWYVPLWRATRSAMAGDEAAVARYLEQAEALGRRAGSVNSAVLVTTARVFGEYDAGRSIALDINELPPDTMSATTLTVAQAYLLTSRGRLDEARATLDLAAPMLPELPEDSEWLPALVQAAVVATVIGGHPLAPWLYDRMLPHRGRFVVEGIGAYCHGPVERHLGLLAAQAGRLDDARAHFEAARAALPTTGADRLLQLVDRAEAMSLPGRPAKAAPDPAVEGEFRREGDVWVAGLAGRLVRLRDSKGMRDLARLLEQPGTAVAALDLIGAAVVGSGLGPALDATARAAYKARLADLEEEIAAADGDFDPVRGERARTERDALIAQLTGAYGLGGRARRSGDPAERARTAVTARIRDALRRIEAADAGLGVHLRRSVRTGAFCVYDAVTPVRWRL